jgi:hypothetical protein
LTKASSITVMLSEAKNVYVSPDSSEMTIRDVSLRST